MMSIVIGLLTFVVMELVAWLTHKYVMHGFLWNLHIDHHDHSNKGFFEKNDWFFLIFAIPSALLIVFGSIEKWEIGMSIGFGILGYGVCYFLVHDIFIHQRFNLFRNSSNAYFLALRRGHKMHHKHLQKKEAESFGMLWVPVRYFKSK